MKKKNGYLSRPPERKELNDTPVKLCNEISMIFRARMRENGDNGGVMSQPGARLILSFLAVRDGMTQKDIVKATRLRPPTVSVILRKMEEEGLAERRQDEHDMRAVRVYLTQSGKKADARNIAGIKEQNKIALEGISESDISMLMGLLVKIRDNLLGGEDTTTSGK